MEKEKKDIITDPKKDQKTKESCEPVKFEKIIKAILTVPPPKKDSKE